MAKVQTALVPTLTRIETPLKKAMLVLGGGVLTAVCAQISIPWNPVPVTLQTFAVLLTGLLLGSRLGAASQISYLALGCIGAPVFAGFSAGPHVLWGPTAGYLWTYPFAACLIGYLAEMGWDRRIPTCLAAMAIVQSFILIAGTLWLSLYVGGLGNAFKLGLLPFIPVEAVKTVLLILMMPAAWKFAGRHEPRFSGP